jgi:hypothetical protein
MAIGSFSHSSHAAFTKLEMLGRNPYPNPKSNENRDTNAIVNREKAQKEIF